MRFKPNNLYLPLERLMLAALIAIVVWASAAHAQPATRPTTAIDAASCVTSDCHANIKASKVIHGPVANNTCDACHELIDPKAHTYRLTRSGADLCTYCHEFDVSAMPVIHKPVKTGECLGCHDPHGGVDRSITRESSIAQLCGRCHDSIAMGRKFVHTPVSKGQCDSCHPPHASMFPKLLDATGPDLCLACHDEFDMKLASARFRHKALDDGCEKCHDVHASNQPMQLVQPPLQLCESCHEKVKTQIAQAKFKHSVVEKDRACLTCHTAHGGDTVKLVLDQPLTLCMSCHKDDIKVDGQPRRVVPAVRELTDSAMHKHGAIKDGQCSGCHSAHGADQPMLLTKVYSRTLYQPFAVANYELCFSCHDVRLVQQEKAGGLTAFRNGDLNLHWVHVKEGQRGRACVVCHTTHASPNARNIRLTTAYKIWNMPIRFVKTDTGGSCSPGCHASWAYDREHPTTAPTTAPARRSVPAIVRSDEDPPVIVSMSAKDVTGADVAVPVPDRPSVLLIVNSSQARDTQILKSVDSIDVNRAHVVAIICGPDAARQAADLAQTRTFDRPIVVDRDCSLAGQLEVHGWPTALVLQSDGLQVAKIGGAPESLALKLDPYIDLAAKKLDAAALKQELKPNLVGDPPTRLPSRALQLSEKFLADAKPLEAQKVLNDALKIDPQSASLQAQMVRTLTALNRPADAIAILSQLPAESLRPGEHDVLRARALIAMDRWDDAKKLLSDVVAQIPSQAEAYELLGMICEHNDDWPGAAKAYRASVEARQR